MSAVTDYREGPCVRSCGRQVRRRVAEGPYGFLVNDRPLLCDECIAVMDAEDEAERQAKEREELAFRVGQRWHQSGIPDQHRELRLDRALSEHPPEVAGKVWTWVRQGRGLMLTGDIGVGKTMLAGAAALEMLWQDRRVRWASCWTLSRLGGLDDLLGRWALILDDLDKVRDTEFGRQVVFEAVDWQLEHRLPLLVTTNLTPDMLAARYGAPLASRLVGYCAVVRLTGPDRRLV